MKKYLNFKKFSKKNSKQTIQQPSSIFWVNTNSTIVDNFHEF